MMLNRSTYEVVLDVPKLVIHNMISNPALIVGLLGHISILQAYDSRQNKFVSPQDLTSQPTKFRVAYIFGTPDDKVTVELGEMEGPTSLLDSIEYKGFTYDGRMKWTISFALREYQGKTKVDIIAESEEERGFFSKFLGKNQFSLADHAIKSHIIPFIRLYMNQILSQRVQLDRKSIEYKLVAEEEGIISDLMTKFMRLQRENNLSYAMIVIKGDNFRGRIILKNGKPVSSWFRCPDGNTKSGNDAIVEAMTTSVAGKAWLYTIDIDTVVDDVFEQIFLNTINQLVDQ